MREQSLITECSKLMEPYITAFYALAENWSYGVPHNELMTDHLVVGLRDTK